MFNIVCIIYVKGQTEVNNFNSQIKRHVRVARFKGYPQFITGAP